MRDELFLLSKEITDTLINRLKTRPQGTLEMLVTKPICIFSLKTPLEKQEGKETLGLTSLAVFICFS